MDDAVSTLVIWVQNAKVAAVNAIIVPRVEMAVRCKQYGLLRNPESLVNKIESGGLVGIFLRK